MLRCNRERAIISAGASYEYRSIAMSTARSTGCYAAAAATNIVPERILRNIEKSTHAVLCDTRIAYYTSNAAQHQCNDVCSVYKSKISRRVVHRLSSFLIPRASFSFSLSLAFDLRRSDSCTWIRLIATRLT